MVRKLLCKLFGLEPKPVRLRSVWEDNVSTSSEALARFIDSDTHKDFVQQVDGLVQAVRESNDTEPDLRMLYINQGKIYALVQIAAFFELRLLEVKEAEELAIKEEEEEEDGG